MAVQITGVRAVVQDYQNFFKVMQGINNLYADLGKSAKSAAADVKTLGTAVASVKAPKGGIGAAAATGVKTSTTGLGAAIGGAVGGPGGAAAGGVLEQLSGIGGQIQGFVGNMVKSITDGIGNIAQIALGIITAQVFNRIKDGIWDMAQSAFNAATSFQTLRIKMEGLVARDLRAADSTMTVADSLKQAKAGAQELNAWIAKLAVKTPFTRASLSDALSMGVAYGFNVRQARELTVAVGDFVAGMGLESDKMNSITAALGRMQSAGTVNGEQLQMLRDASVNINDVFAQMSINTGKSTEELKRMQTQGILPASEFIKAFTDMADKDFGGSMERMGATWETVTSNIQDFIGSMIGIEAMGPAIDNVTKNMGASLERLLQPDIQGAFRAVGEILNGFVNDSMGMIPSMYTYGANLMTSFSNGIIAAANALLSALSDIGGMIAMWLKPGSPPKLLPDIDKWGTAAIGEWLQGFSDADFGILDDLQKPIRSALEMVMGKEGAGQAFAGLSKQIMAGLGGGGMGGSEALFQSIAAQTGEFGAQIANLARQEFQLAAATKEVADANARIAASKDKEEKAYTEVQKLAKEYNAMRKAGASKKDLAAKLAELNAAKSGMKIAKSQRTQAEKDLVAAQDKEAALKNQVALQQKLVDQMLEIATATKDTAKELAKIGGVGGMGIGGIGTGEDTAGAGAGKDKMRSAESTINKFKENILAQWNSLITGVQEKLAPWSAIWKSVSSDPLGALQSIWDKFKSGEIVADITDLLGDPTVQLGKWAGEATNWILTEGPVIIGGAVYTAITSGGLLTAISNGVKTLGTLFVAGFLQGIKDANAEGRGPAKYIQPVVDGITLGWTMFTIGFKIKLREWLLGLATDFQKQWDDMKTNVTLATTNLSLDIGNIFEGMKIAIESRITDIKTFFETTAAAAFGGLGAILDSARTGSISSFTGALDGIKRAGEGIAGMIDGIATAIKNLPSLPADWQHHSPSRVEQSMTGFNDALNQLSKTGIPSFNMQVSAMASPSLAGMAPSQTINNMGRTMHYEPHYQNAPANQNQDLSVMQVMMGG